MLHCWDAWHVELAERGERMIRRPLDVSTISLVDKPHAACS
jgi:hypothetical protein